MICSSLNRLFLTSPPRPWRAMVKEKSHLHWTNPWGACHDLVPNMGRIAIKKFPTFGESSDR
jgi:hypothetical protein